MKVIAFSTSNSIESINKKLAAYAGSLIEDADLEVLDLNNFEAPLFSIDLEASSGNPETAKAFLAKITEADAIIMSSAEHNGNYPAVWKNLFDWCSRIERNIFQDKPLLLLTTSPGGRGGASVMQIALNGLPHFGADIKASLSIPSFHEQWDSTHAALKDGEFKDKLLAAIEAFQS